jgi:hypothetical protein
MISHQMATERLEAASPLSVHQVMGEAQRGPQAALD